MAESVDALVSNTSGVTSIPVRPRVWVPGKAKQPVGCLAFFLLMPPFLLFSGKVHSCYNQYCARYNYSIQTFTQDEI